MTLRDALAAAWRDLCAAWPWVLLILGLWIEAAIGDPWAVVAAAARGAVALEWGPIESTYHVPASLWRLHLIGLGAAEVADPVRMFAWPSRLAWAYAMAWLVAAASRAIRGAPRMSPLAVALAALAAVGATLDWLLYAQFDPIFGTLSPIACSALHDAVGRHLLAATLGTLLLGAILEGRSRAGDGRWRMRLALVHGAAVLVTGLPESLRRTVGNVVVSGPLLPFAWLPIHVAGAAGLLLGVAWSVDPTAGRSWPRRMRSVGVVFMGATLAVYGLSVLYMGLPSAVRSPAGAWPAELLVRPFALAGRAAVAFLIICADLLTILTLAHLGRPDDRASDDMAAGAGTER